MGRLSKEEQLNLAKAAQLGDMSAFQKLVEELGAYVKYVANNIFAGYEENGIDLSDVSKEDVYQSGFFGLISAVYKYDSSFDVAFSTYAYSCIAGEIREQLKFELSHLGITNAKRIISRDSIDEDNGLAERLESMEPSVLEKMIEDDENNEAREKLTRAFADLSENEKKVLFMINGIDCDKTSNHKKIANELGISEMMVKDIINEAMKKISIALRE